MLDAADHVATPDDFEEAVDVAASIAVHARPQRHRRRRSHHEPRASGTSDPAVVGVAGRRPAHARAAGVRCRPAVRRGVVPKRLRPGRDRVHHRPRRPVEPARVERPDAHRAASAMAPSPDRASRWPSPTRASSRSDGSRGREARHDGTVAAVGLIRLRVVVLALIMALLALAAGRIFDSVQGTFVIAAIAPDRAAVPRRWRAVGTCSSRWRSWRVAAAVVGGRVDRRGTRAGRCRRGVRRAVRAGSCRPSGRARSVPT